MSLTYSRLQYSKLKLFVNYSYHGNWNKHDSWSAVDIDSRMIILIFQACTAFI